MDYKKANLEHRTTKWLKEHCILECKAHNEPSSWVQTSTNEERRYFLLNGTLDGYGKNSSSTENNAASNNEGLEKLIIDAVSHKMTDKIGDKVESLISDTKYELIDSNTDLAIKLTAKVNKAIDNIGYSSIINLAISLPNSHPFKSEDSTSISPTISLLISLRFDILILPPIFFSAVIIPVRVGFKFIFNNLIFEFLLIKAATIKKAALDKSEGTEIF